MRGNDTARDSTDADESPSIDRRDVLKSSAGVAVGSLGLAAGAGSASATIEALIEGLKCTSESNWLDAPSDYPILDLRGDSPSRNGSWPDDPDELTIFVHGLGADRDGVWRDNAYTFQQAAEQNGLQTDFVGVVYDTGSSVLDWDESVVAAQEAGGQLADWLRGYDASNDVGSYRLVAHSLGGHVTGTVLDDLGGDVVFEDVGLLGPAIPRNSVCEDDGQYAAGIQASAEDVHNYRSWDDEVVCDLYEIGAGNEGLGCRTPRCGWFDDPPENFHDHSQTFSVDAHCDYPRQDVGCVDDLVEDFQND